MRDYLVEESCSSLQWRSAHLARSAEAVPECWPDFTLRHFMLVFPLICHPSVYTSSNTDDNRNLYECVCVCVRVCVRVLCLCERSLC